MRINHSDATSVFTEGDSISWYITGEGIEMVAVAMTRDGFMRLVEKHWGHGMRTYAVIEKALSPPGPPVDLGPADSVVVEDLIAVGRKISAVKYVRGLYKVSLREAKETVDWYCNRGR